MNKSILQRWYVCRSVILLSAFAAMLAGCGSNAGVGSGGTGLTTAVAGKVADGYLVNAPVFLDKNGNYRLDAGEPFATTDAQGAFTLAIDPADVGKCPLVALAIEGVTIDRDTNQTIAHSYLLSMPKESVSDTAANNFISPLTSLVREMMEAGLYTTRQQAADALRIQLQLAAGTDVMADYLQANNTEMHTAAQNIATLMGNQMGQVFGTSGSTATTVDVNRYRTMMGAIVTNMSSVRGPYAPAGMANLNSMLTTLLSTMPPGQH